MNIAVLWDSITFWAYDREQGWRVERLKLWWFQQDDLLVYNRWISWYSTQDFINDDRAKLLCQTKQFDTIIIALWSNDSRWNSSTQQYNVSLDQFQRNLLDLFEVIKIHTKHIIFLWLITVDETKTTPIPRKTNLSYNNDAIKQYNQTIQDFTYHNNVDYIHLYDLLDNNDLDDGLHPNASGHQKIFEKVLDYLQKTILVH